MMKVTQLHRRGFTLLEMLLSIAIIGVLAGLSVPVVQTFQNRNDLDIAAFSFVESARHAHTLATGVSGDTAWGVHATSGAITLFRGTSFAARDAAYDHVTSIPTSITVSGTSTFVFSPVSGKPTAGGTITFTSVNNDERDVVVNAHGALSY